MGLHPPQRKGPLPRIDREKRHKATGNRALDDSRGAALFVRTSAK